MHFLQHIVSVRWREIIARQVKWWLHLPISINTKTYISLDAPVLNLGLCIPCWRCCGLICTGYILTFIFTYFWSSVKLLHLLWNLWRIIIFFPKSKVQNWRIMLLSVCTIIYILWMLLDLSWSYLQVKTNALILHSFPNGIGVLHLHWTSFVLAQHFPIHPRSC